MNQLFSLSYLSFYLQNDLLSIVSRFAIQPRITTVVD